MPPGANDDNITEWKAARDSLTAADTNLHDLRKWGFSFVTGLLTVDAVFASIPGTWKLAALLATFVLIAALVIIDRNYHVLEDTIAERAAIVEARVGFELTQDIRWTYRTRRVWRYYGAVYWSFDLAVLVMGVLVLPKTLGLMIGLWVGFAAASVALLLVGLFFRRPEWVDWGTDSARYQVGDSVLFTVTNAGEEVLVIEKGTCLLCREEDPVFTKADAERATPVLRWPEKDIRIGPDGNARWLIRTDGEDPKIGPGLYRIAYFGEWYFRRGKIRRSGKLKSWPDQAKGDVLEQPSAPASRRENPGQKPTAWDSAAEIEIAGPVPTNGGTP